jgi:hypothetical protein
MRRRSKAPRPSRDNLCSRPQSLRFRHRRQAANEASGRLARAPPMPLARRLPATPPESQHVAVKPLGLHVRRIDQRTTFRKRAPLSVIRRTGRFVQCWRHLKVSALVDAYLLLPARGEKVGMRGPNRRAQKCGAQNRGEAPLTLAALDLSPHAGRGDKRIPFSRRIRARAMPRHSRKPSLRGVKRRSNPAGQCTLASLSNETALPNWIASLRSQ